MGWGEQCFVVDDDNKVLVSHWMKKWLGSTMVLKESIDKVVDSYFDVKVNFFVGYLGLTLKNYLDIPRLRRIGVFLPDLPEEQLHTLVIVSENNACIMKYTPLGKFLTDQNFQVLCFDKAGQGGNEKYISSDPLLNKFSEDFSAVLLHLKKLATHRSLTILTEGIGSLLIEHWLQSEVFSEHSDSFKTMINGFILLSSVSQQMKLPLTLSNTKQEVSFTSLSKLTNTTSFYTERSVKPHKMSIAHLKELIAFQKSSMQEDNVSDAKGSFEDFHVLFLYGKQDKFISSRYHEEYFENMIAKSKESICYPDIGRDLLVDDLIEETVFSDIANWITNLEN